MPTLSFASPAPTGAGRPNLSAIHPLLLLPIIAGIGWFAADLMPGSGVTPAQAQTKSADRDPAAPAAQSLSDSIPAQMPTTLFSTAPASAATPGTAYASLADGSVGAPGNSGGGGSGSSGEGGGQSNRRDHRANAIDPAHHLHTGFERQATLQRPQRSMSPIQRQAMPRPQLPPRVAYAAVMAPRVMPAPRMIYRPTPFGGGFHFSGGHFGGGRR